MSKNIEVEGGELALRNTAGDIIIIPKNKRSEALKHLDEGNHQAIDEMASKLPYMKDYAEDGTLIKKKEKYINEDGNRVTVKEKFNNDGSLRKRKTRVNYGFDEGGKTTVDRFSDGKLESKTTRSRPSGMRVAEGVRYKEHFDNDMNVINVDGDVVAYRWEKEFMGLHKDTQDGNITKTTPAKDFMDKTFRRRPKNSSDSELDRRYSIAVTPEAKYGSNDYKPEGYAIEDAYKQYPKDTYMIYDEDKKEERKATDEEYEKDMQEVLVDINGQNKKIKPLLTRTRDNGGHLGGYDTEGKDPLDTEEKKKWNISRFLIQPIVLGTNSNVYEEKSFRRDGSTKKIDKDLVSRYGKTSAKGNLSIDRSYNIVKREIFDHYLLDKSLSRKEAYQKATDDYNKYVLPIRNSKYGKFINNGGDLGFIDKPLSLERAIEVNGDKFTEKEIREALESRKELFSTEN